MLYTVMVIEHERFENKYGMEMIEEKIIEEVEHGAASAAEKTALKLVEKYEEMEGEYKIFVHYLHKDSPCYLNPMEGMSPVGVSWL